MSMLPFGTSAARYRIRNSQMPSVKVCYLHLLQRIISQAVFHHPRQQTLSHHQDSSLLCACHHDPFSNLSSATSAEDTLGYVSIPIAHSFLETSRYKGGRDLKTGMGKKRPPTFCCCIGHKDSGHPYMMGGLEDETTLLLDIAGVVILKDSRCVKCSFHGS